MGRFGGCKRVKVTYRWLKDFVEIKISPQALAEKLTMAGLEVVALEKSGDDFVFEIEITSNRPDWLSVYGVAREVSAVTGAKLKTKSQSRLIKSYPQEKINIIIEDKKDCSFYAAKIMRNIKVGPAPGWLAGRLESVGCRSVNNVVDVTNYVLFELGHPLHAFDLDRLILGPGKTNVFAPEIAVRRAKPDEELVTIDGIKRSLDKDILIIAAKSGDSAFRPVALAGIMGGKDTEVTFDTKNILLEAAVFNPVLVRSGRQRLGLQSEAAYRFERGVALSGANQASLRSAALIKEYAGGDIAAAKNSGSDKSSVKKIDLDILAVENTLGRRITLAKCKMILSSLGFLVKNKSKNILEVTAGSWRRDIAAAIDLIEEIARIYGFENIPQTLAKSAPQVIVDRSRGLVLTTKEILLGLGLNEAITYSLIDREALRKFGAQEEPVAILNPLSQEQEVLTSTILAGLLRCVAHNLNQKQGNISFFEVGKRFIQAKSAPQEELVLGIALCGEKTLFLNQGVVKDELGALHLKGILETLFSRLGVKQAGFVWGKQREGEIGIQVEQEDIGSLFSLPGSVLEAFEIKNKKVVLAQVSLARLFARTQAEKKFIPAPKYPEIIRDISFIAKDDFQVNALLYAVNSVGLPLRSARIVDYYRGKQVPQGSRALTLSCVYRLDERTLTEEEVAPLHARAVKLVTDDFGLKLR